MTTTTKKTTSTTTNTIQHFFCITIRVSLYLKSLGGLPYSYRYISVAYPVDRWSILIRMFPLLFLQRFRKIAWVIRHIRLSFVYGFYYLLLISQFIALVLCNLVFPSEEPSKKWSKARLCFSKQFCHSLLLFSKLGKTMSVTIQYQTQEFLSLFTLRGPPLDSETDVTGKLWSTKTNRKTIKFQDYLNKKNRFFWDIDFSL